VSRGWPTLLPALACFAYFFAGIPLFWLHARRRGLHREARVEARRPSPLVPRWLVYYLLWMIGPFERALVRARVTPNQVTLAGLVGSCAAAAALAAGWFDAGGWLYLAVGILDLCDGRIARATGRASRAGAFCDSVADRWSECAIFAGMTVYYQRTWVIYVILTALCSSLMVSYTRARAEGLGVSADAGTMQRPERVLLLGVALAAAPFAAVYERRARPIYWLAVAALAFLAVTATVTALGRARAAFRRLRADEQPTALSPPP
jgi:phosphatidylglycerophosphate synthase